MWMVVYLILITVREISNLFHNSLSIEHFNVFESTLE